MDNINFLMNEKSVRVTMRVTIKQNGLTIADKPVLLQSLRH